MARRDARRVGRRRRLPLLAARRRRPLGRRSPATTCSRARALPAGMTVRAADYAGAPVAADAILPFRAERTQRALHVRSRLRWRHVVIASDPLNRVGTRSLRRRAAPPSQLMRASTAAQPSRVPIPARGPRCGARLHADRDPGRAGDPRGRARRRHALGRAIADGATLAQAAHARAVGRAEPARARAARQSLAAARRARRRRRSRRAAAFVWRETVGGTPESRRFARSRSRSPIPAQPDYALARLVGYLGQPPQP